MARDGGDGPVNKPVCVGVCERAGVLDLERRGAVGVSTYWYLVQVVCTSRDMYLV